MGFKNYRSFVSKYTSLSGTFQKKLQETSLEHLSGQLKENFFLTWLFSYVLCLSLIILFNLFTGVPFIVPSSLALFLSSYWGASVPIALILTFVLKTFFNSTITITNFLEVTAHTVLIKNTNSILAVFACSPPILHDKNDFSFFMENFQPFSIELHPAQDTIFFLLYGSQGPAFSNKIKECSNLLNSFFSSVHLLSAGSAKKFLSLGLDLFSDNPFADKEFFSLADLKQLTALTSSPSTTASLSSDQPFSGVHNQSTLDSPADQQPFVFLLSLIGAQGTNSFTDNSGQHFFRGVRIGLEYHATPSHSFSSPLSSSHISHSFCSLVRLPDKQTAHADAADVSKMYFYVLHKFFQYQLRNLNQTVPIGEVSQNNQAGSSLVHTIDSLGDADNGLAPARDESSDAALFESPSQSLAFDTNVPDTQPVASIQHQQDTPKETGSPGISLTESFTDLKKISFQFTQFCHLYCPVLNNEFRKQTTTLVNNFVIPNGCLEHIILSNKHFFDFFKAQHANLDPKLIFQTPVLRDSFIEFIQEKEMNLIDNVCHISSLIILSTNNFDIQENDVFSLAQNLEKDFF